MPSMSRSERAALCNTALEAGENAPTLCGSWTVKDLVIHLLVRERDPLGSPGIVVPQLERLTDRASRRLARQDFTSLVERVRSGPPAWSPLALPVLERAVNTLELYVHHEDIRRAAPDWRPRELAERDERAIWKAITVTGKGLVRPLGVPVEIRWADDPRHRTAVLRKGENPAVVTGAPSEIALLLFGRTQNSGLELTGPEEHVRPLRRGDAGV